MFTIDWTVSAIETVWHFVRKHPEYAPGFRRRPMSDAIDRVIYDH